MVATYVIELPKSSESNSPGDCHAPCQPASNGKAQTDANAPTLGCITIAIIVALLPCAMIQGSFWGVLKSGLRGRLKTLGVKQHSVVGGDTRLSAQ